MNEIPGTVLCGSIQKRCYLYVNQSEERMHLERAQARKAGVQDVADFVFVLDGQQVALSYDELKARILAPFEPVRLARIEQLMTVDPDPRSLAGRELIRLAYEQEKAEAHLMRPTPETPSALVCRHGVDTGKKRCLQCYPLQGDKYDPIAEDVQLSMDRDRGDS